MSTQLLLSLSPTNLVSRHLALWGLVRLQALVESPLDGLHLSGNGLEGFLIMLLTLQGFVQTLLLLAYLRVERKPRLNHCTGSERFW